MAIFFFFYPHPIPRSSSSFSIPPDVRISSEVSAFHTGLFPFELRNRRARSFFFFVLGSTRAQTYTNRNVDTHTSSLRVQKKERKELLRVQRCRGTETGIEKKRIREGIEAEQQKKKNKAKQPLAE
jgi:hypothetical protein